MTGADDFSACHARGDIAPGDVGPVRGGKAGRVGTSSTSEAAPGVGAIGDGPTKGTVLPPEGMRGVPPEGVASVTLRFADTLLRLRTNCCTAGVKYRPSIDGRVALALRLKDGLRGAGPS